MELSFGEMLLIAVAIVVLFGPDKLPKIARELGTGVRKMRGAMDDIKTEIMKETDNPVSEIKREIDKVKDQVKDLDPAQKMKDELNFKKYVEDSDKQKETKSQQLNDDYEGPVSR